MIPEREGRARWSPRPCPLRARSSAALRALALSVAFLGTPVEAPAQSADQVGQWGPVLNWGRQAKHATLLPTGNALIWSTGDNAFVWDTTTTGSFTPVPFLTSDLHCAGQATLADGKVIVVGGVNVTPHIGTPITALFDPFTNTWTEGTRMNYARWYGTATILFDGRLLASNGDDQNQQRVTIPEVYDPVANTWTALPGADRAQSLYSFMFMMPDGRVYEPGPKSSTYFLNLSGSGSWTAGPSNSFGSSGYSESCAMYGTGKILRAGGGDPAWANAAVIDTTAASPAWRDISPMAFARRRHNMVILADGNVMAVGGTLQSDDESKAVLAGEIWNRTTEKWTTVASMKEARMYHSTALLLADGRVLAGGGEATGRLHAEIYSPPYLFKGARPAIASAPASASYGATFTVTTLQAADIVSVALMRPGAVTHAYDHNQRYIPLTFTRSGSDLLVSAPASGNIAPPGYHMLVIKNSLGVPSVAAWIRLSSSSSLVPGKITGLVTNASTGAAISGATISYVGGSTTTASNGSYTLSNVLPGEYLVTASKTGFATSSQTKSVPPGSTVTLNFALVAPGSISGHVSDSVSGNAIAGATVSYTGGSVTTDSSGNYTATVASGTQTISASAPGYQSLSKSASVPANGSVTVNFALVPRQTTIQGEVFDAVTSKGIAGATVSYSGGSTVTDAFGFYLLDGPAPGTYTVTASAAGYVTASSEATVVEGFVTTADFGLNLKGGSGVSFAPTDDAYVNKKKRDRNFGSDGQLRVRKDELFSYLKFSVSGVSGSVKSATLSLFNTEGSNNGGSLYTCGSGWSESKIIFKNAPAISGSPVASAGAVSSGSRVDFDVTSVVAGNGTYSFALRSSSSDPAAYSSKEGSEPPSLVLVFAGGTPPPTADFSVDPRTGEAPLTVQFSDLSTGAPSAWQWLFGDGGTSTEQHPTHIYRGAGSYNVTLAVTNAGGTDTLTRQSYITVNPPSGGGPVEHHESQAGGSVASMIVETETHVDAMGGQIYIASVATKPHVDVTSVVGLGLTWKKVRSQCGARDQTSVTVFVSEGEPLISEPVVATLASVPSSATIAVSAYTGANPLDPIGNVLSGNTLGLDGACSGGVDSAAYSFHIPVTAPGAAVYCAVAIRAQSHTPGPGYTERYEVHAGTGGGTAGLAVGDKVFGEPTSAAVDGTLSGVADWAIVIVEIVP